MSHKTKRRIKKNVPAAEPEFNNRVEDLDGLHFDNGGISDTDAAAAMDLAEQLDKEQPKPTRRVLFPKPDLPLANVREDEDGGGNQRGLHCNESDSSSDSSEDSESRGPQRPGTDGITVNLQSGEQITYSRCPMAIPRCYCGIRMRVGKCGQGENAGRLFFTCAKNIVKERCSSFSWVTNPLMQKWLLNYPKDAAYNPYAHLHAVPKKQTRVIRAALY